jgi:hypothetical protein
MWRRCHELVLIVPANEEGGTRIRSKGGTGRRTSARTQTSPEYTPAPPCPAATTEKRVLGEARTTTKVAARPAGIGQFRSQGYPCCTAAPSNVQPRQVPAAHMRASPAQHEARRQSQCIHANCSPEACTPPPALRTTTPSPEEPRRTADTPRHAPYPVRAERTTRNSRGACLPGKENSEAKAPCRTTPQTFPGRIKPRASRAQAAPARRKRPESQRSSAQAAGARAHTPTARRSLGAVRPAPSPRSRAEAQEPHRRAPHLRRAAPDV